MKNLLLLFSLTIVILSCGKEKEMLKYTGTLYKDCAKNPAANIELRVYQEDQNNLGQKSGGELARFVTDNDGFFLVTFEDDNGAPIQIETINTANPNLLGVIVIQNIDRKSVDLGNIYLNNRGNAYVFIETTQDFDSEDTCNSPVIKDTILRKKIRNYGHESDQKRNKEVQQSRKAVNY